MYNSAKRSVFSAVMFGCIAVVSGQETKPIEEYPSFKSETYVGESFHMVFESAVSKLKNTEEYPRFWEELRLHYKGISEADFLKNYKNGNFFKYVYTFRNIEKSKLKINLSAQELVDSPLIDIFQDFSLDIEPDDAGVEISFIAPGAPEKIDSPLNIMFWKEGAVSQGRRVLYRAGSCRVYRPPTRLYIRKELETVIRKTGSNTVQ